MATSSHSQHSSTPSVIEVNESSFGQDVLVQSQQVPVVVDFWAPWCGPCRTLGPLLERLATEARGAFVLAKINVDNNQRLAASYQVQGIPAVKAFRDGRMVDEFSGALPESQVRAWLQRVVPSPTDKLAEQAAVLEQANPEQALALYRQALEIDARHPASLFGLGRMLVSAGDASGADLLAEVPAGTPFYPRAQALMGLADFLAGAADSDAAVLSQQVAQNGNDLEARYRLAAHLVRDKHYTEAMDQLLAIVMRNRAFEDDGARRVLVALFELLGDEHSMVAAYRRKLANALF